MNTELFDKYSQLLSSAASQFAGVSDDVFNDIKEDVVSVENLRNDMDDFSNYLSILEKAISDNDRKGSVEAMLLARVTICNAENAYSNLAESIEALAVELRDFSK